MHWRQGGACLRTAIGTANFSSIHRWRAAPEQSFSAIGLGDGVSVELEVPKMCSLVHRPFEKKTCQNMGMHKQICETESSISTLH